MLIENRYFIPDGLCEAVEAIADQERKTQFVAVMYRDDTRIPPGMARMESVWADLRTGKNCAWIYGPGQDELIALRPAMILWIPPAWVRAGTEPERAIREEEEQQEIDDHSWYGVGA